MQLTLTKLFYYLMIIGFVSYGQGLILILFPKNLLIAHLVQIYLEHLIGLKVEADKDLKFQILLKIITKLP